MSAYTDIQQYYLYEKDSKKQLWLEGRCLEEHSFVVGKRYDRTIEEGVMTLTLSDVGRYVVSKKKVGGKEVPVLDIVNKQLTEAFENTVAIQIAYKGDSITVTKSEVDRKIERRERSFMAALNSGQPLNWGSFYHGAGILDGGLHEGFERSALPAHVSLAVELDRRYMDISCRNNTFWAPNAVRMSSPMELLAFNSSKSTQLHGICAGVPCTAASKSGRSKHKSMFEDASLPEANEKAGAQIFYFLDVVNRCNPALAIVENVNEWFASASYMIARTVLKMAGYTVYTRTVRGADFGALEDRERTIMLAISRGLVKKVPFDFATMVPRIAKPANLAEVLIDTPDDSDAWSTCDYLIEKEKSDIATGKGFRLQWVDPTSATKVGTIGRGYQKRRSTEVQIRHAANPDLVRLLWPVEHARCKTIPERAIAGVEGLTLAHQVLGQSVVREWFVSLGIAIGEWADQLKLEFYSAKNDEVQYKLAI
ncbi:DNA cytosine methyltransferase [Reinekea sp. G2M2-21]|uniref:DNA cytosine methyltransferase n=1 Tax=Reinekea sp. G2M2-21 TaxID=2788942 RepID=UPI0018AA9970|nr:DNA cytosine methyltransferase [Reinekea sp. G2M2-21]